MHKLKCIKYPFEEVKDRRSLEKALRDLGFLQDLKDTQRLCHSEGGQSPACSDDEAGTECGADLFEFMETYRISLKEMQFRFLLAPGRGPRIVSESLF